MCILRLKPGENTFWTNLMKVFSRHWCRFVKFFPLLYLHLFLCTFFFHSVQFQAKTIFTLCVCVLCVCVSWRINKLSENAEPVPQLYWEVILFSHLSNLANWNPGAMWKPFRKHSSLRWKEQPHSRHNSRTEHIRQTVNNEAVIFCDWGRCQRAKSVQLQWMCSLSTLGRGSRKRNKDWHRRAKHTPKMTGNTSVLGGISPVKGLFIQKPTSVFENE